jgi:hypothetical protein
MYETISVRNFNFLHEGPNPYCLHDVVTVIHIFLWRICYPNSKHGYCNSGRIPCVVVIREESGLFISGPIIRILCVFGRVALLENIYKVTQVLELLSLKR